MSDLNTDISRNLFQRAQGILPGGVNSPVRAFKSVGGEPRFIERALGCRMWDADGNELIDYVGSWGPMLLGHNHPDVVAALQSQLEKGTSYGAPGHLEVELAELVVELVPSVEMVRMVNSGTEATMAAIRLARGATGRDKVLKFEGCYHGHGDSFLIKAGSGAATLGQPDSPGVTAGTASDTLVATFNDLESVKAQLQANAGNVAAIIVEPVVGNMGVVAPVDGFLEGLRSLCDEHGALLIFDEVMTGFRLAAGGAQERFGIRPDLTTMGKVIGGGLPVGAYGGRRDLMEQIAPAGPIYQAGTLSGNPLAMAAGRATLARIRDDAALYDRLEEKGRLLEEGVTGFIRDAELPCCFARVGSMWTLFFTPGPVRNWSDSAAGNKDQFGRWFHRMLSMGFYLAPSSFEANFIGDAHSLDDITSTIDACKQALEQAMKASS